MEEILSSIRRIISEEDEEDGAAAAGFGDPAPAGAEAGDGPGEPAGAAPMAAAAALPAAALSGAGAGLLSAPRAEETARALARLNETLDAEPAAPPDGDGGLTVERLARESMRPMLEAWLDRHLPEIVERLVREEIERLVARSQRRDPW